MHIEKRSRYQMRAEEREANRRPQTLMCEFRSAWPIAMACLLACFAISEPVQADIQRPPDEFKVESYSYDCSTNIMQWNYTVNHYAGGGMEPMLDIQAHFSYSQPNDYSTQSVGSALTVDHKIMPLGTVPDGFTGQVPYNFNIRVDGSIPGWGWFEYVSAYVDSVGYYGTGKSLNYDNIYSGMATPGSTIHVNLAAGMRLSSRDGILSEGQILVDPYIYVDPTWQYASYFGVFQYPGPKDNGVWQQVNRDWMNPVSTPEPATLLLLGPALAGLGLLRRRFTK